MTSANPPNTATSDDSTLSLPRVLCLHGGGVNASIFRAQFRSFLSHPALKTRFRFVFVEAPFFCDEGIGVHPVYSAWGPFRRWFRWLDMHPTIDDEACRSQVLDAVVSTMEKDDRAGAIGEWVCTLGFSQGAKVAVSLLYEMQLATDSGHGGLAVSGKSVQWRMGVIFAGRAPFVALSEGSQEFPWCQKAGGLPIEADFDTIQDRPEMKLRVPTVHVHGLRDEGLDLHRKLVGDFCAPLTTTLVEWDGPHRIPIKRTDVDRVVEAMVEVASEYGI